MRRKTPVEKCKHWMDKRDLKKYGYNKMPQQMREIYEREKEKMEEKEETIEEVQQWYNRETRESRGQI